MDKLKILTIRFKNTIHHDEIPLFRGAIVHTMDNANILFHNHEEDRLRYAYPLIQYKRINKCAAIVCIGEGTEAIGEFFSNCNFDLSLGKRSVKMEIDSVKAGQALVQIWEDASFQYHLSRWLPLNQENYQQYQQLDSLADRYAMLEKILVGNILSFAKGIGIHFEKQIVCKITQVDDPYALTYKDVKMMAFNIAFKTNVSLPDYIGLGKGVSLGNGVVMRKRKREDENEQYIMYNK